VTPFACHLCTNAGRPSGPRYGTSSAICRDCVAMLASQGRMWCNYRKHVVATDAYNHRARRCHDCQAIVQRKTRGYTAPPAGYLTTRQLAKHLYCGYTTIHEWLDRGWPVTIHYVGSRAYIAPMDRYPDPPDRRKATR
jgi:hypothetical protein